MNYSRPGLMSLLLNLFEPLAIKSLDASLLNLKKVVKKYRNRQLNQNEIKELKNKMEKYYIKVRMSSPNLFVVDKRYENTMRILAESYDSGNFDWNSMKMLPRLSR